MKIVSRFITNDGVVGYVLDDGGFRYSSTERGLYDLDTIEGLIASGYKIMDYHGNITTPEGINIKDLANEPCTASESEIQSMLDIADNALSEAECTKYFSHDVVIKEIELKQPKVTIKTREELVAYLNNVSIAMRYSAVMPDIRPLNSFVAREALFTIEELVSSDEVKEYFRIIEMRRKLNSYGAYKKLIEFLIAEGVLNRDHEPNEVRAAYLSWGICGIKTAIVDTYVKVGVTSSIYKVHENLDRGDLTLGRVKEFCLLDKSGVVHYLGGKADLSLVDDYSQEVVEPVNNGAYWDLMRTTSLWETEYKPIECFVVRPDTRTYYKLMDENGLTFRAKVNNMRVVITDDRNILHLSEFLQVKCMDGSFVYVNHLQSEETFAKWNLARQKARELIKARTIKPPVDNSYDLCIAEGVTSENAVNYIARRINEMSDLNSDYQDGINYFDAASMYRNGPEKSLIQKYNPDGLEYETIDELIDIMCGTREELIEAGEYLTLSKQDKSYGAQAVREEIQLRPLEQLEFVKNVRDGRIAVDYLGAGMRNDGQADVSEVADLIELMLYKKTDGAEVSMDQIVAMLNEIEDIEGVIRDRDSAFKGYIKDRAILNAARANQCAAAVYVTRIYREAANVPIEEQRHYMFDCISLKLQDKKRSKAVFAQREFAAAIETAFQNQKEFNKTYRDAMSIEAPSIALKLMFRVLLGRDNVVSKGIDTVTIAETYSNGRNDSIELHITVSQSAYAIAGDKNLYDINKCCTLYDWCQLEMTSLAFNLYCLNANITPWAVIPKKGVEIPTYNFVLNYMYKSAISKLSQGFQDKVASEKAKVREFVETYISDYLLPGDILDEATSYSLDNIDCVLHLNVNESIANYRDRFFLHNAAAVANGNYLKRMRLKSDVIYKNYADETAGDIMLEGDEYELLTDPSLKNLCITTTAPVLASKGIDPNAITSNTNIITQFKMSNEKFHDVIRWTDLVYDKFTPTAICILSGSKLVCAGNQVGKLILDLKTMSRDEANDLAAKGIFYQLSAREFLVVTTSGKYRLEIKNA